MTFASLPNVNWRLPATQPCSGQPELARVPPPQEPRAGLQRLRADQRRRRRTRRLFFGASRRSELS